MIQRKTLIAELRENDFGSAGSRRLLRAGRIPAVVYGKGIDKPQHISVDAHEFALMIRDITESTLSILKVGDEEHVVLVKDFQENLLTDTIEHIDFYAVKKGEKLRTEVSITLEGDAKGCRVGGVLEQVLYTVEIEALPKDLPETLTLNVDELDLNEVYRLKDIKIGKNVEILENPNRTVCSCKSIKEESLEASDEEDGEVTVIGEDKEAEE